MNSSIVYEVMIRTKAQRKGKGRRTFACKENPFHTQKPNNLLLGTVVPNIDHVNSQRYVA